MKLFGRWIFTTKDPGLAKTIDALGRKDAHVIFSKDPEIAEKLEALRKGRAHIHVNPKRIKKPAATNGKKAQEAAPGIQGMEESDGG